MPIKQKRMKALKDQYGDAKGEDIYYALEQKEKNKKKRKKRNKRQDKRAGK